MNRLIWITRRNGSDVIHAAGFRGYRLEVRNFLGTRSMEGAILRDGAEVFRIDADRKEWSVADLKQELIGRLTFGRGFPILTTS
jgi:hypothetical protein